jgi:YD repeat-containing protein
MVGNFNPPDLKTVDRANINITSGFPIFIHKTVAIGPADSGLSHSLTFDGSAIRGRPGTDSFDMRVEDRRLPVDRQQSCPPGVSGSCAEFSVQLGTSGERFLETPTGFLSLNGNGASLTRDGAGRFIYVGKDGTRYTTDPSITCGSSIPARCGVINHVVYPDGKVLNLAYETRTTAFAGQTYNYYRLRSAIQSNGYQILYRYEPDSGVTITNLSGWGRLQSVVAINRTVDYCDPSGLSCSFSTTWPTASLSGTDSFAHASSYLEIAAPTGELTRFNNTVLGNDNNTELRITSVKAASSIAQSTITYQYTSKIRCTPDGLALQCSFLRSGLVGSATIGGGVYSYSYSLSPPNASIPDPYHPANNLWAAGATGPDGRALGLSMVSSPGYFLSLSDGGAVNTYAGGQAPYGWAVGGTDPIQPQRVVSSMDSTGRVFNYKYDARGNVVERRQRLGASDDDAVDLVVRAGFDSVCSLPAKCNKPNWVQDANGNRTDFTYDPTHGGVLSETSPAPDASQPSVRPQKRYSYVQRYAWVKGPSGGFERSASPIWVLSRMSLCRTGPPDGSGGCAFGASDEVVTTYDYGPDAGPNNLLLRGQVVTAADGNGTLQSYRTCWAYDALGNKIGETSPNAALASCP